MKPLSIIIITYNRADDTLELLQDIAGLDNPELLEEVILLNNKSTDDYSVVQNFLQNDHTINFRLIEAPENLGVSKGRNYASTFANGEILVYLDDDVVIKDQGILFKILQSFDRKNYDRPLGVVSFKVLYSVNGQMQVNAFPHKNFNEYKDRIEFLTYYYAGCAHAITKEAWDKTGNYPSNFFYGMEEYDFSYRLLNKGFCIKYESSVVIYHKESPLGRKPKSIKIRMMWVNKSKVAWWYLPKKYFYSTAVMWSVEFLMKTNFNIPNFIKGWMEIFAIPGEKKRVPIGNAALEYLKKVKARLWY
jgi:GT2 family glycosyltransferase